jgi:ABC-2 type transport system permease protein
MAARASLQRIISIARKEVLHILRDPMTLFMTFFVPVVELIMLGYAIDTNVRDIPTVVLDEAGTQESRVLVQSFENSKDFKVISYVRSDAELHQAIVAGWAHVGIKVPENYSRRLEAGDTAQILVLVDGSISSLAGEAVNVGNAIALRESLSRVLGNRPFPVECRPRVLFNPATRSPNFFIPGLMVVMCQMMSVMLSGTAIVREKERGTLEQLYMTPIRPPELILGKIAPYLVMTFLEFCIIALLMRLVFQVPIHGAFVTLLGLALPFVLAMLALGLWISTKASTRDAAMQMAFATMLPSIFLSGYVFPLDSMPTLFWWVAQVIPTTWLIDAARGVILRGAGWRELWPHAAVLWTMALAGIIYTSTHLHKRLA